MRTLLSAVLLTSVAAAQTEYIVPPGVQTMWGSSPGSGTGIAAFFSSKVQYLYDAPVPVGQSIQLIGFRGRPSTSDVAAYTVDGEISMSTTLIAPGLMSTTFASNRGFDQRVVIPRQTLNVAAQPASRSLSTWINYPLQTPFVVGGSGATHLNVEVTVWSTTSTALLLDRCFANASGSAAAFGQGCGSGTIGFSGTPDPGASFDIDISGAVPGFNAWLLGGFNVGNLGPVPLPLDLGPVLGMTGCNLYLDPTLPAFARTTDGLGAASVHFGVPMNSGPIAIAFQWLYQDPTAPNFLRLRATDAEIVHLGPRSCPSSQYLFSTNPTASSGFTVDGGVAMRIVAQ